MLGWPRLSHPSLEDTLENKPHNPDVLGSTQLQRAGGLPAASTACSPLVTGRTGSDHPGPAAGGGLWVPGDTEERCWQTLALLAALSPAHLPHDVRRRWAMLASLVCLLALARLGGGGGSVRWWGPRPPVGLRSLSGKWGESSAAPQYPTGCRLPPLWER